MCKPKLCRTVYHAISVILSLILMILMRVLVKLLLPYALFVGGYVVEGHATVLN